MFFPLFFAAPLRPGSARPSALPPLEALACERVPFHLDFFPLRSLQVAGPPAISLSCGRDYAQRTLPCIRLTLSRPPSLMTHLIPQYGLLPPDWTSDPAKSASCLPLTILFSCTIGSLTEHVAPPRNGLEGFPRALTGSFFFLITDPSAFQIYSPLAVI